MCVVLATAANHVNQAKMIVRSTGTPLFAAFPWLIVFFLILEQCIRKANVCMEVLDQGDPRVVCMNNA